MYAGVGARETPADMLETIERVAMQLARAGWTLRTGMSPGADQAFYRGARAAGGRVELYLPWPSFQAQARPHTEGPDVFVLPAPGPRAYALAARFHPGWSELSAETRELRARDVHEVLGRDLFSPARLVVCWTADGSLDGTGAGAGGTGQALRVAHGHGVGVLNVARPQHLRRLRRLGGRRQLR